MVTKIEAESESLSDPILSEYLQAEEGDGADQALRVLIENEAAPIIRRVLVRKNAAPAQREDLASAAREQLLRQLTALRRGERTAIRDFHNYAASVAYTAWAEHLRSEHPGQSMLLNRLRYLLENRTSDQRFALWTGEAGESLCGFAEWRGRRSISSTPKLQWLLVDVTAAAAQAFGRREVGRDDLVFAVTRLFTWLEQPIELRDLVSVLMEVMGLRSRLVPEESGEVVSSYGSPREEAIWKEYLLWLWLQMEKLSPRQCVSFLLNSNVIRDFELFGLASIRTLAPRFAMTPDRLAVLWQRLPLDDLALAAELQCTRQQVINLRRVARDLLGKAWSEYVAETSNVGNTPARSPSSSS